MKAAFLFTVSFVWLCLPFISCAGVVGYAAGHSEDEDDGKFAPFLGYLDANVGPGHRVVFDTHERIRSKLLNGDFDIAILSPLNYIETKKRDVENKVRIVAKLEKHASPYYQSNLVIHEKYNGGSVALSSFKFLYPSLSSTSSYLYPLSMLKEKGVDVGRIGKEIESAGKTEMLRRIASGEQVVCGVSNATFEAAKRKGVMASRLYKIETSPDEIPYDAVVVYRNNGTQRLYESAIASLFVEDAEHLVRKYMPQIDGITGLHYAVDEDYDALRKRSANLHGRGVFKVGLSLALQPDSIHEKKNYFRIFQSQLYNDSDLFLMLQIYDKSSTRRLLEDLSAGHLDIGQLPPVFAGEAVNKGMHPIFVPAYEGNSFYNAVFIKSVNNAAVDRGQDLQGKILALGGENSASSMVYPLKYLEDHYGIGKSTMTLMEGLSADEIITAVATGEADVGALAEFRLGEASARGHDYVKDVTVVPGLIMRIPNGAYVVNATIAKNRDMTNSLREQIEQASLKLGDRLNPSLSMVTEEDKNKMVAHYVWANPKDTRPLVLILIATTILVIAAIAFMYIYRPH